MTTKQNFNGAVRLAITFLVGLVSLSVVTAADDKAPNIVLILSDDQAWTDYGFMGHDAIETPHLDRLAREGILFRRGYVPTALCRPSLMTLLTGQYASVHGVTGNDPSPKNYAPRNSPKYVQQRAKLISYLDKFATVPKVLGKEGYLSHQSGKLWEGSYQNCGFTHGMTRGFPQPGGRHGDDGLKIGRKGMKPIADFVQEATEKDNPFFMWYAPFLPHTPHTPPERLLKKYKDGRSIQVAKYFAMCDWFDETIGELREILEKNGADKNTLIIYVTDNGWIQNPNKNGYAPRSKQSPNEGGIRTPIIFHWPEKLKPADRPELVSSIDIVPTILAAAKTSSPDDLPGLNLMNNLTAGTPIKRDTIFGEGFAHDIADVAKPEASLLYRWAIQDDWKLLLTYDGEVNRYLTSHPRTEKRPQLFNLTKDPSEEKNLAGDHPEIVARLVKKIDQWYPVTERKVIKTFE